MDPVTSPNPSTSLLAKNTKNNKCVKRLHPPRNRCITLPKWLGEHILNYKFHLNDWFQTQEQLFKYAKENEIPETHIKAEKLIDIENGGAVIDFIWNFMIFLMKEVEANGLQPITVEIINYVTQALYEQAEKKPYHLWIYWLNHIFIHNNMDIKQRRHFRLGSSKSETLNHYSFLFGKNICKSFLDNKYCKEQEKKMKSCIISLAQGYTVNDFNPFDVHHNPDIPLVLWHCSSIQWLYPTFTT